MRRRSINRPEYTELIVITLLWLLVAVLILGAWQLGPEIRSWLAQSR